MFKDKRYLNALFFASCFLSHNAFASGGGALTLDGIVTLNDKPKIESNKVSHKVISSDNSNVKLKVKEVKPVIETRSEIIKKVRRDIVDEKINNVVPITSSQILRYKKKIDGGRKAASAPVNGDIKLINKTIPITLGKGGYDKTIYLSSGFVTSLIFLDVKGNPWPVSVAVKGDGDRISTTRTGKHIIFMSTDSHYSDTNMAFVLDDINVPINFRIITNTNKANEKVEIVIQELGPEAKDKIIVESNTMSISSEEMYNFLDMLPPEGSVEISINGSFANAWAYNGFLYIRTSNADLISPAYSSGGLVESGDGAKVYKMSYSPMLMFVHDNRVYQEALDMPNSLYNKEFGAKNKSAGK